MPKGRLDVGLPTRKGPARLIAERLSYDFARRSVAAQGVSLYAPNGERIARAASIQLKAPDSHSATYRIRAAGIEALLERQADGRWKHFDLLPEPQEKRAETPLELTIESAKIGLLDRTASQPQVIQVTARNLRVDGSGSRWLANGQAKIAGYGSVEGLVRISPEVGVGFNVAATGLEASGLLKAVQGNLETRKVAALKSYAAESAIVSGSFRGHVSPRGALAFEAEGRADATGLNLKGSRVARISFVGSANESSLSGAVQGEVSGGQAALGVKLSWADGFQAAGTFSVQAGGTGRIPRWASAYLPKELKVGRSQFNGWFRLDKTGRVTVDGTLRANEAQWDGERLAGATASLHVDPELVLISDLNGKWMGGQLEGNIGVLLRRSEIRGAFKASRVNLGLGAKRIGGPNLNGWANLTAMLTGRFGRPVVDIRSQATASVSVYGSPQVFLGNIEFAGRYSAGKLTIQRFVAAGRNGVFVAKGLIDVGTSQMNLHLDGNGVKLAEFSPDLSGTGLFRIDVTGTPNRPTAKGRAEVVGAEIMGYGIPFAAGTVRWDANGVLVRELMAVKGATTARGYLSWNSHDRQLDGELAISDVILSDWLGDGASGSLTVPRAIVRGTLDNPFVSARGEGANIVMSGVRVDRASFDIQALRNMVFVREMTLATGEGQTKASGYLELTGASGVLSGEAKHLPLGRLLPGGGDALSIEGFLDGSFITKLNGSFLHTLTSSGFVRDVSVNGALLGSGEWKAQRLGGLWTASLTVGQIDRFIEVSLPYFSENDLTLRGTMTAYNLDAATVVQALKRYLPRDAQLTQRLDTLQGDVGLSAEVAIDQGNLSVSIDNASVERLALDKQELGTLSLRASRSGSRWDIRDLTWRMADQRASVTGIIDEKGDLALDGELFNLRGRVLRVLFPDMPNLRGSIDLFSFSASGPTRHPTIQASLQASNVGLADDSVKPEDRVTTDVNIGSLLVQDGSIKAEGWLFYKGIRGEIRADLPLRYPFEIPEGQPIHGSLTLATNQLEAFTQYVPAISSKTTGQITGGLTLSGSIDKPVLYGDINLDAPIVALEGVDTFFKNVKTELRLRDNTASVDAVAEADRGGSVEFSSTLKKFDWTSLVDSPTRFLSAPIEGFINIKDAKIHHNANKYGAISLVADGKLRISGSMRSPLLQSDRIALKELNGTAPSEFSQQADTARPEIDPRFDVRFDVLSGAKAKAANAEVYIYGNGNLSGSLYRPLLTANFALSKGSLKLPNARIQLREGGSMRFAYRVDQEGLGQARLDVDLQGSTNVAALRFGDTVERYAIDLQMRGDILEAGQLQITAQSNPPDLSRERILDILGQGEFFQGLAQGNQSAIASFALPTFLDPVTSQIAKNFGLEYLMVEYDLQKRTTLTAARTLGNGFTLMGRRQVSPAAFGQELFEVKLSYRLPFNIAALRSFTLSLGSDQDNPWKFSVEYGKRF